MQLNFSIPIYKEAPFLRLLVALVLGILLQWYLHIPISILIGSSILLMLLYLGFYFAFAKKIVSQQRLLGAFLHFGCILLGGLLVFIKDIRNEPSFFKSALSNASYKTIISLKEPLTEKTKTYKSVGKIISIVQNDTITNASGNVIVYFKKDSTTPNMQYGSTIVINKPLQAIKNSGNPGSFNYEQQSLFNGITHQVFLNVDEYHILAETHTSPLQSFLFKLRTNVLNILDKNILPLKEKGVAEALLIGYRDDLDKDLVQAYSNTGTIHVIAISGLHLGFIYLILVAIFKPFEKKKFAKWITVWLKPILIIAILWIFSLLAGGAASILRSAIMFTCIVIGDCIGRKTSIYNTLAFSAFIILCLNPFSLWDVGFQLSYAAVLSIVIFMQPLYKLFYFKNKVLNWFWQLNAVTLSAQILTIPIVIYHFHQFPNLFLFTNIVAVPLSTIILGIELLLLVFSWATPIAHFIGLVLTYCIRYLDNYIEWCNHFSFAITDYLQMSILQCYLLYAILISFGYWLLKKYRTALWIGLGFIIISLVVQNLYHYNINAQQKLIVYNVPNQQAVDLVEGNQFEFVGDSIMLEDGFFKNFHIKPGRIYFGTKTNATPITYSKAPLFHLGEKNILLLNNNFQFKNIDSFKNIEVAVFSKNPKIYIDSLIQVFNIKQIVADASNPSWKINLWQKDCDRLKIPFYNTNEQGAFIKSFH